MAKQVTKKAVVAKAPAKKMVATAKVTKTVKNVPVKKTASQDSSAVASKRAFNKGWSADSTKMENAAKVMDSIARKRTTPLMDIETSRTYDAAKDTFYVAAKRNANRLKDRYGKK